MLSKSLSLFWFCLFSPRKAADASKRDENFIPSSWIYAAFNILFIIFFCLKPADFPRQLGAYPQSDGGFLFWLKVTLWEPPLLAAWMLFLMGLIVWFREGWLIFKIACGVIWAASEGIMLVLYIKYSVPKFALAFFTLAWLGLFYPLIRRVSKSEWKPVITLMLGINAIGIVQFIPMTACALMNNSEFYEYSQIAGGIWILLVGTLALRHITGMRLARTFMPMLLSIIFQALLAFSLHFLGLVPKEILKALFYG